MCEEMREEVFALLKEEEKDFVECQFVLQCAPLIAGLKVSNLFIIPNVPSTSLRFLINQKNTGLSFYLLAEYAGKAAYLIYRKEELESYIRQDKIQHAIESWCLTEGKDTFCLSKLLIYARKRYTAYCLKEGAFPHELGVLLGYPIEDVSGFIENDGRHCLHSGYWKVYANKEDKIALFRRYEEAKIMLIRMLRSGCTIGELLQISQQNIICVT